MWVAFVSSHSLGGVGSDELRKPAPHCKGSRASLSVIFPEVQNRKETESGLDCDKTFHDQYFLQSGNQYFLRAGIT